MRYLLPRIRAQPFSKVARSTLRLPLIPTRQVMIIAPPDALTALFAPWAKVYSHSKPLATIVVFRIGNVQMKFEAAGAEQGGVEAFDEVRCAHDEDQLLLVEAVHFRQELVHH